MRGDLWSSKNYELFLYVVGEKILRDFFSVEVSNTKVVRQDKLKKIMSLCLWFTDNFWQSFAYEMCATHTKENFLSLKTKYNNNNNFFMSFYPVYRHISRLR